MNKMCKLLDGTNGIKKILRRHKYFFCILTFLLFYNFCIINTCGFHYVEEFYYPIYAVDSSMGFVSRVLPGALYRFFCGIYTEQAITIYLVITLIVFFVGLALCFEKMIVSVAEKERTLCCKIVFLFLVGSFTTSVFVKEMGIPEFYWALIAMLFIVCLSFRPLYFLTVPLCLLTLFVNYSAILCYVPFFCILILYRISVREKKSEKCLLWVLFFLSSFLSVVLFIYLLQSSANNLVYSLDEFNEILAARGVKSFNYIDYYLYGRFSDGYAEPSEISDILSGYAAVLKDTGGVFGWNYLLAVVKQQIQAAALEFTSDKIIKMIVPYLVCLPILYYIFRYYFREFRSKQNTRLKRFVIFCFPVLFIFTLICSVFFSSEPLKWFSFAYLLFFISFLYIFYCEKEKVLSYLQMIRSHFSDMQIIIYVFLYTFCVMGIQE